MSDAFFYGVGAQTSKYPPISRKSSDRCDKPIWFPRDSIPWSPELKNAILHFFVNVDYPFRTHLDIPFKEPLRSEIRRFFLSLDAYIESPHPVIPYKDILYGSADKDYAKTLKRIKRKSFEKTWIVDHFDFPDWWDDVPWYHINDIGDIFNYSYLIFWRGDADDYIHGFEPVTIDHEMLSEFKDAVRDILPPRASFQKIDPTEVLSQMSSSMSLDGDLSHKPHYQIKNKYLHFSKNRGICDRSVISVSPENCRDTVINNPSDLNTISLIDKQVLEILRVMPEHIHLNNKEEVTRRLRSFRNKCDFFVQRDLKKEGITKPRELLKAMLEVLHEEYPDINIFEYTTFYDNYALRLKDGSIVYPNRGHGLGMANALTTIMQLAIHRLIIYDLTNLVPDLYSKMLCINDDFVAGFKDADTIFEYWNMEDIIMDKLSIIREPTKSFCSDRCFVLAERYFYSGSEYEKTSYQLRELLLPLSCFNVTHAKEYFVSAQTYCSSKYALRYLDEIRDYWGYEFYPTEFHYPHVVGGWINEKVNSVDLSLVSLEELELKSYVFRGMKASNVSPKRKYTGDLVRSPLYILMGDPKLPEEYHDHFDLLPEKSLNEKYGRLLSHSRDHFRDHWNRFYKKRQRVFKIPYEVTFPELLIEIKRSRPTTLFYPNDTMIKQYHPCNVIQGAIKDIYLDPNPHLACVSYFNNTSYEFKEVFSIRFTNADATTKKTSSLFSKEIQRALKSEEISVLMTGKFHEVYYPKDGYNPMEQYLNPVKIGEVTAIMNWGKGYPEVFEHFQDDLIKEKREVFNYLFSIEELFEITRYNLSRVQVTWILDFSRKSGMTFLESLEYIRDNMPEVQEIFYEPDYTDSDEDELFHLDYSPQESGETKILVRITDLFEVGCPIFWNVRNDWESYRFDSYQTEEYLRELDRLTVIATFPHLYTEEGRLIERDRIKSGEDQLLSLISERSGVFRLLEGSNGLDDEGMEDAFDIFGDG